MTIKTAFSVLSSKWTVQRQREKPGCVSLDKNPKWSMVSSSHRPSLNHDPNEQKQGPVSPPGPTHGGNLQLISPAGGSGMSGCSGTSTATWQNRRRFMATCMQWHIVSPRCQDMTSGLARQGGGVVVTVFPGLWTWWRREFMMLLEHYWVFCPLLSSLQDCFWFFKTGEDLCRKLVVAIAVWDKVT